MSFEEYWKSLCEKNPGLKDGEQSMTLKVESFKKSMSQSFQMGRDQAEKTNKFMDRVFGGLGR